jgi:hypothetical protein
MDHVLTASRVGKRMYPKACIQDHDCVSSLLWLCRWEHSVLDGLSCFQTYFEEQNSRDVDAKRDLESQPQWRLAAA